MEEARQEEARDHHVKHAEERRDVEVAKAVLALVVRAAKPEIEQVDRDAHAAERGALDEVVEPVTRRVVGQVALVTHDRNKTEEEDADVGLESLEAHAEEDRASGRGEAVGAAVAAVVARWWRGSVVPVGLLGLASDDGRRLAAGGWWMAPRRRSR